MIRDSPQCVSNFLSLISIRCRCGFKIVARKIGAWSSWTHSVHDVISSFVHLITDFVRCYFPPSPTTSSTFTTISTLPSASRRLLRILLVILLIYWLLLYCVSFRPNEASDSTSLQKAPIDIIWAVMIVTFSHELCNASMVLCSVMGAL